MGLTGERFLSISLGRFLAKEERGSKGMESVPSQGQDPAGSSHLREAPDTRWGRRLGFHQLFRGSGPVCGVLGHPPLLAAGSSCGHPCHQLTRKAEV
jgi:hypothetical protein